VDDSATRGPGPTGAVRIKFCGLTRPDDAREASRLGAAYVGAIFAESPRRVSVANAMALFEAAGSDVGHVAVFGSGAIEAIASLASRVGADVVQLHGRAGPATVEALRARFPGDIWAVVSLAPGTDELPPEAVDLAHVADALMLDSRVAGRRGGPGVPLDWPRLSDGVAALRVLTRIILAGGLNPENVSAAMLALEPDIVDVSSGVESSPGIKDHGRMLAFAEAVRSASIDRGRTDSSSQPGTE
jgi:phosphoribosylanthranilate isomerase